MLKSFILRFFGALQAFFGVSEILFIAGMALLYRGTSVLLSPEFAQAVCGAILAGTGLWTAWVDAWLESKGSK